MIEEKQNILALQPIFDFLVTLAVGSGASFKLNVKEIPFVRIKVTLEIQVFLVNTVKLVGKDFHVCLIVFVDGKELRLFSTIETEFILRTLVRINGCATSLKNAFFI